MVLWIISGVIELECLGHVGIHVLGQCLQHHVCVDELILVPVLPFEMIVVATNYTSDI